MVEQAKSKEQQKPGNQVAAAVCAVMGAIRDNPIPIPKSGHNPMGGGKGFDYLPIDVLNAHLQPLLAQHGLMFLPSIEEYIPPNEFCRALTIRCQMKLIHAPSGEVEVGQMFGQSLNPGDKGVYAAYAGACKYFLVRAFCIPTGNDLDTDAETFEAQPAKNGNNKSASAAAAKQQIPERRVLTPSQQAALVAPKPQPTNGDGTTITGRLTKDPVLREVKGKNGQMYDICDMSVLTYADDGAAEWSVVAWRDLAKACAEHFRKDDVVTATGKVETRTFRGQETTYLTAKDVRPAATEHQEEPEAENDSVPF